VPVGEDQRQHVELMRDIALRFNSTFGETLIAPEHRIPALGARIMDLQDPARKMSTTGSEERGRVHVDDDEATIAKKLRSAVTDSGSGVHRDPDKPGISNLIDILAAVRGSDPEAIEREFERAGYGDFKSAVGEEIAAFLAPVRERYAELRPDAGTIEATLEAGAHHARAMAADTLSDVREAMGIGPGSRSFG
jgi:tryptophanyl-tRNA synthetase